MTLQDIETAARRRSQQGMRLRMHKSDKGWEWHWTLQNLPGIFSAESTTIQTKPVAFAAALGLL